MSGAPVERVRLRARNLGVTLLELLLVMVLLAVLFGAGLGLFAALDSGQRTAAGALTNALRRARNTATFREAPARVLVDREARSLTVQGFQVVGTWRFEGRRLEGAGLTGILDPSLFHGDGFLGDAVSFAGRPGAIGTVPVHLDPAFDLTDGFAVECVLRHEDTGGGRVLSLGEAVVLELGQGGVLRGRFRAARGDRAVDREGALSGRASVTSQPGVVPPWTWTRVRLGYDRRELWLDVDGVRVASLEESAPVAPVRAPLVLSDERHGFPGSIDDLVVSAVVTEEPVRLEGEVTLLEAPAAVHFAPGGELDRRHHRDPARFLLAFGSGARRALTVGLFGTVDG